MKTTLTGWGNYPKVKTELVEFASLEELSSLLTHRESLIPRGCGRSYGDAALNSHCVVSTARFKRFISFDESSGLLVCEAGVTLDDILTTFVPRGWFPAVTPGTRFVSLGGAIASDIHGKNHHTSGSFSSCVSYFDLLLPSGEIIRCSPTENGELFQATFGGMGLTGIVVHVALRLKPVTTAYIRQRTIRTDSLELVMQAFRDNSDWAFSVAWIDCQAGGKGLGRSVLTLGEHAAPEELTSKQKKQPLTPKVRRKANVPFFLPGFTLNRFSISLFNNWIYRRAREGDTIIDYDRYFYPLDRLLHWNRIYGRKGFVQFQCALPEHESDDGIRALLEEISTSGLGSFLSVLKQFGPQEGLLSFPQPGFTLALDFPTSSKSLQLLERLNAIVTKHSGRLYLTKDACMSADVFNETYGEKAETFRTLKARLDPTNKFSSLQSERLKL